MKTTITILLYLISIWTLTAQDSAIEKFMNEVQELENNMEYIEALELIDSNLQKFYDYEFRLLKEKIYLNEKMDHYAENLHIFEYAHEKGYFFLLHPDIAKYKPYRVFPEFEEISQRDLKIRAQVNAESKTTYKVHLPKDFTGEKRWPLLLIFHGGGSNLDRVQKHWQSETLKSGYIKVYLQSYNHYDTETYGWRSGDNIADIKIFRIFIEIIKEYPIDYEKIILAGISAGATYAIDVAIRNVIPANGIIAFCPGIPKDLKSIDQSKKANMAVKVYMVGGEKDYYLPKQKEMAELFTKSGRQFQHEVFKDMGHQYPEDEDAVINTALTFFEELN